MEYRITKQASTEWVTYVEANSEEEALSMVRSGDCEWDQEDCETIFSEPEIDTDYEPEYE